MSDLKLKLTQISQNLEQISTQEAQTSVNLTQLPNEIMILIIMYSVDKSFIFWKNILLICKKLKKICSETFLELLSHFCSDLSENSGVLHPKSFSQELIKIMKDLVRSMRTVTLSREIKDNQYLELFYSPRSVSNWPDGSRISDDILVLIFTSDSDEKWNYSKIHSMIILHKKVLKNIDLFGELGSLINQKSLTLKQLAIYGMKFDANLPSFVKSLGLNFLSLIDCSALNYSINRLCSTESQEFQTRVVYIELNKTFDQCSLYFSKKLEELIVHYRKMDITINLNLLCLRLNLSKCLLLRSM